MGIEENIQRQQIQRKESTSYYPNWLLCGMFGVTMGKVYETNPTPVLIPAMILCAGVAVYDLYKNIRCRYSQ